MNPTDDADETNGRSRHGIPGFTASDALLADPVALGMLPHPEGGWYREMWQHEQQVSTPRGRRPLATSVAFLLLPGDRSAWHRVASDELWLWQGGGRLRLSLGGSGDAPAADYSIELTSGGQHCVPAGVWQTAEPASGRAVQVACIVAPGFDFADFELAH